MAFTTRVVEELVQWCLTADSVADVRASARSEFFGLDLPQPAKYTGGTGGVTNRERRFLGWFVFCFALPDGRRPAELAAAALLQEPDLSRALKAITGARYVTGAVTSVISGRGFYLEMEDQEFEVSSPYLSHTVVRESMLSVHLLPVGRGRWLAGPGWVALGIRVGPGLRSSLKELQFSPIDMERFLQRRASSAGERDSVQPLRDATLEAAVARMSEAAKAAGCMRLVMLPGEWVRLVLPHMEANDNGFAAEVLERARPIQDPEQVNKWLALAMNIWNNTPQPDRGGKSAFEILREHGIDPARPPPDDE
ncbi:MAG: hypothetical protein V1737_05325 [Chloroflexota bacterium]